MNKKSLLFFSLAAASSAFAITSPISTDTVLTGTDSIDSALTIDSGITLSIGTEDGGTTGSLSITNETYPLVNNGNLVVNKNSTLSINASSTKTWMETGKIGGNVDVYGTLTMLAGSTGAQAYNGTIAGKTVVHNGGTLQYTQGVTGLLQNATLEIQDGGTLSMKWLTFRGSNSKLVVGGDNAIQRIGTSLTLGGTNGTKSTLDASACTYFNAFTSWSLQGRNNASMTFILPSVEGGIFEVGYLAQYTTAAQSPDGTESIILQDFRNGVFKITKHTNLSIVDVSKLQIVSSATLTSTVALVAKDAAGNVISLGENQSWQIDDNGFFNIITTVPEPAEWAAIFGALALGLAIYRRRK